MLLTVPRLPAWSVYRPAAIAKEAVPDWTLAVGVKVSERARPEPGMLVMVPPVTVISPVWMVVPTFSLKVNVMVAVWPALTAARLLVIATVVGTMSTVMFSELEATLTLPATSVALAVIVCTPSLMTGAVSA